MNAEKMDQDDCWVLCTAALWDTITWSHALWCWTVWVFTTESVSCQTSQTSHCCWFPLELFKNIKMQEKYVPQQCNKIKITVEDKGHQSWLGVAASRGPRLQFPFPDGCFGSGTKTILLPIFDIMVDSESENEHTHSDFFVPIMQVESLSTPLHKPPHLRGGPGVWACGRPWPGDPLHGDCIHEQQHFSKNLTHFIVYFFTFMKSNKLTEQRTSRVLAAFSEWT